MVKGFDIIYCYKVIGSFGQNFHSTGKSKVSSRGSTVQLPRIPDLPLLGTQTNDLEDYTNGLEDEKLASMLQALKDREREELMGVGDQCEYMNEANWPDKGLKPGYELDILFIYPEDEEDKLIWVPGKVTKVLSRNDEKLVASIKWDKDVIGEGESDESDEQLLKSKWNPDTTKPGTY